MFRKKSKKFRSTKNIKSIPVIVVGIDPSLTGTAISYIKEGNKMTIPFGVIKTTKREGVDWARQSKIVNELAKIFEGLEGQVHVFIEGYMTRGARAKIIERAEIVGIIKFLCLHVYKYNTYFIHPKTLKNVITGNGNASKEDMQRAVKARWGFYNKNDDIIDAYSLMRAGQLYLAGEQRFAIEKFPKSCFDFSLQIFAKTIDKNL